MLLMQYAGGWDRPKRRKWRKHGVTSASKSGRVVRMLWMVDCGLWIVESETRD